MRRAVSFAHSDIEGVKALSIAVEHNDGSVSCVKLFKEELEEALDLAEPSPVLGGVEYSEYSNVREILGHLIGRRIEDITQHDRDEWDESHRAYIQVLLSGGDYLKFFVGPQGFSYSDDTGEPDA